MILTELYESGDNCRAVERNHDAPGWILLGRLQVLKSSGHRR